MIDISNHLRTFSRTSVRRGYLLAPLLVSVLIVAVTCLSATSIVVTIFDAGEYPYIGNHLNAFGIKAVAIGAIAGSLITLALLYFRLLTNDMFEALTEPWFKGRRRKATFLVLFFVAAWLAPPLIIKAMIADPDSGWFALGSALATGVEYLNRYTGGIVGLLISVISVIAFYITILQLRDFQSRVTTFGELMEQIVDLVATAHIHDKMHVICYTPAIGFLAESRRWNAVERALLTRSDEPDASGNCNVVEMIVPKWEDLTRWHAGFVGRRTKRGNASISADRVQAANVASQGIRQTLSQRPGSTAYREVDFDVLPGYYCFFTLRRAIIVTPLFVPLLAEATANPRDQGPVLPPPDMIGYSTTDRGVIDSMFEQWEHVLKVHDYRQASRAAPHA